MEWLVIYEQQTEGCDYTIGCGTRVDVVKAENETELQWKLSQDMEEFDNGDFTLKSVRYVPLLWVIDFDLLTARRRRDEQRRAAKHEQAEAQERAEFLRLQAKFAGKVPT